MPILTVQSGPMKGQVFEDLTDFMGAQDAMQQACKHSHKHVVNGICGKGLSRKACERWFCPDCHAVLSNNTFTPIPDYATERQMVVDFWKQYRLAADSDTPTAHALLGNNPKVGQIIVGFSWQSRTQAMDTIKENLGVRKFPDGTTFVALVEVKSVQPA